MGGATVIERTSFDGQTRQLLESGPVTMGLGDIEGFLAVNERHGRAAGDAVLARVAEVLRELLPDGTILCRIGGDEFACLLPGVQPEEALLLLDDARRRVNAAALDIDGTRVDVAIRFGVASYPEHAETAADLLRAAEQAVHRARELGGNRVAIYVEDKMVMKSNYYPRAQLDRLSRLAGRLGRTEASLLREALGELLDAHRDEL